MQILRHWGVYQAPSVAPYVSESNSVTYLFWGDILRRVCTTPPPMLQYLHELKIHT